MRPAFPDVDPLGPAEVTDDPAVAAGAELARGLLAPQACQVDRVGVPRTHLDAVAAAGLMDVTALARPVAREVAELIAGADASTWFCWANHQTPLRVVAEAPDPALRERWLAPLRSGQALAGVAFAHLRRPGPPAAVARPDGRGGWRLDGTLPWVTSWTIADVVLVLAVGVDDLGRPDGRLVGALLQAGASPPTRGVAASDPLPLAALAGTHTVELRLSDVVVPAGRVPLVTDLSSWLVEDAARTVHAVPAVFGTARSALAELHRLGQARDEVAVQTATGALLAETRRVRADAYRLADAAAGATPDRSRPVDPSAALGLRAHGLDLAQRATGALVTAQAGRAMALDHPAQRLAREAMFHLVQASTRASRAALLARYQDVAGAQVTRSDAEPGA